MVGRLFHGTRLRALAGVGAEMDAGVQGGEGDGVSPGDVEEHLARRRRVAGPDLEPRTDERRDVVEHGDPVVAGARANALGNWLRISAVTSAMWSLLPDSV